jgi:hypothetical protein
MLLTVSIPPSPHRICSYPSPCYVCNYSPHCCVCSYYPFLLLGLQLLFFSQLSAAPPPPNYICLHLFLLSAVSAAILPPPTSESAAILLTGVSLSAGSSCVFRYSSFLLCLPLFPLLALASTIPLPAVSPAIPHLPGSPAIPPHCCVSNFPPPRSVFNYSPSLLCLQLCPLTAMSLLFPLPNLSPNCYATTRMDPRNKTHDDGVLHAWFIFNLNTNLIYICTVYRCLIFTQYASNLFQAPCKNNKEPHTYLEGQLLARGDEFPTTLAPSLVTIAPPFSLHPFHPLPTPKPTLHCLQR